LPYNVDMLKPLDQKYKSAYYQWIGSDAHYAMFDGIRTRCGTMDDALQLCEKLNDKYGLPHINVYKSSTFNQRGNHVS